MKRFLFTIAALLLAVQAFCGTPIKEYETASWGQESPFNKYCPAISQSITTTLTGSAATAGAILCRYYQWPAQGSGSTPAYAYASTETGTIITIQINDLGSYDYSLMPLVYADTCTTEQKNAVANLCYDIATSAQTSFGAESSPAPLEMLLAGLVDYFSYGKGAKVVYGASYDSAAWTTLMQYNLYNYGPVLYYVEDASGNGRTIILDGYDDEGLFHVNWCDEGDDNGWFSLSDLTKDDVVWNCAQSAIVDLVKDETGTSKYCDNLVLRAGDGYEGISSETTTFETGVEFTVKLGNVLNMGAADFSGKILISLFNSVGGLREDIAEVDLVSSLSPWYASGETAAKRYETVTCKISGKTIPGDIVKARFVGQNNEGVIVNENGATVCGLVNQVSPEKLAAGTALNYDKGMNKLTFTLSYDTHFGIFDADGNELAGASASAGDLCELSLANVPAGTYELRLISGKTVYRIKFKI